MSSVPPTVSARPLRASLIALLAVAALLVSTASVLAKGPPVAFDASLTLKSTGSPCSATLVVTYSNKAVPIDGMTVAATWSSP